MKLFILTAFTGILFTSCGKQETETPQQQPEEIKTPQVSAPLVSPSIAESTTEKLEVINIEEEVEEAVEVTVNDSAIIAQCKSKLERLHLGLNEHRRISNLMPGDSFDSKLLQQFTNDKATCPLDDAPYTFTQFIPKEGQPYASCPHDHN